jgi:hypothetical protein
MKSKDLAALGVQCQPQPLLIRLFTDKAAEFVCFHLQGMDEEERIAAWRELYVKVGGRRLVALHQKSHQPLHAHADGTAQRKPFVEQPLDQRPVLTRDSALLKFPDKLAATGFAAMVLLPVVSVAVLFVVCRPALGATVSSYDHGPPIND